MGSESGGSAVDSVAGEHSGKVSGGSPSPWAGVGTYWESLSGCLGSVLAEGGFEGSLKVLKSSFDLSPGVSNVP